MASMNRQFFVTQDVGQPLELLDQLDQDSVQEFCQISLNLLLQDQELKPKQLTKVSSKLNVEPNELKLTIHALSKLLLDFTKWQKKSSSVKVLNTSSLEVALAISGIPHSQTLIQFWAGEAWPKLSQLLEQKSSINLPHWKDLEWRLDAIVQSRAQLVMAKPEPVVTVVLTLGQEDNGIGNDKKLLFQTGPQTLTKMADSLESALKLSNGAYARKLQRHL